MLEDDPSPPPPGYEPDNKTAAPRIARPVEIAIAINANKYWALKSLWSRGISYDQEVLRLIDKFNELGILVGSVVITNMLDKRSRRLRKQLDKSGIALSPLSSDQGLSDRSTSPPSGMGKGLLLKLVAI